MKKAYNKHLCMGSSTSTSDNATLGGILGGFIVLSDDTECGLTKWNVVRDNRLDESKSLVSMIDIVVLSSHLSY